MPLSLWSQLAQLFIKNVSTKHSSGHFKVAAQGVFAAPRILGPVAVTMVTMTIATTTTDEMLREYVMIHGHT